jgi:hypothetical protein
MRLVTLTEALGSVLAVLAMVTVCYAALALHNDTALGAVIGVLSAATSFFLRAKVLAPTPPRD